MKKYTSLSILFLLLLTACLPESSAEVTAEPISLAETAVPHTVTAPPTSTIVSTAVPTPTPTATLVPSPTATRLPTVTPSPAIDLFPGWVFSQENVFLRVDSSGELQTIFDSPDAYVLNFSPDGRTIVYVDGVSRIVHLRDLVLGEDTQIFTEKMADTRLISWWDAQPEWMLLSIAPTNEYVNPWFGGGLPALVRLNGQEIITPAPESARPKQQFTDAAVSPDGQQIAFDIQGEGWLYDLNVGLRPFSPADFGYPLVGETQYALRNPQFSPNGRFLAWHIKNYQLWDGYVADDYEYGVAIFDLEVETAVTIPHFILSAADHNYMPPMRWADDDSLLIYGIFFPEGDPSTASAEAWTYRSAHIHWPTGRVSIFAGERVVQAIGSHTFLTVRGLGQPADGFSSPGELLIENLSDGSVVVVGLIELSQPTFHSPDGRTILFGDQLFELESRVFQPITLPPDLDLVTWTAVP
jgi:hypothetical protein